MTTKKDKGNSKGKCNSKDKYHSKGSGKCGGPSARATRSVGMTQL
jgi:hypothetical protein